MFRELFGVNWDHFDDLKVDLEKKITLHDYEKFFPEGMLEHMDTESDEFKLMIKKMNLNSKTQYE